jgi:hypothetical protein
MAYVIFEDAPNIVGAQAAEEAGRPYWPLVQRGTFGGCGCAAAKARLAGLAGDPPAADDGRTGMVIAVVALGASVAIFLATLALRPRAGL